MPSIAADPAIRVAVGVLRDGRGRVLVARRPGAAHQGGKWEFPGGKVDESETVLDALRRELAEELGIELESARRLIRIPHSYPDRQVLLDVWLVNRYRGVPHGREGQPLRWVNLDNLGGLDLPAADRPILTALQLPALYLISDCQRYGVSLFLERLEQALCAGARLLQLREPGLPAEAFRLLARQVAGRCHAHGALLLINADPSEVAACDADGVHLNSHRLQAQNLRPLDADLWVAASCHNRQELAQAERITADFVVLSPVLPTRSHPRAQPLGWDEFERLAITTPLPVYALGGLGADDRDRAWSAGAQGLAMISGVWEDESIAAAVAALTPA